MSERIAAAIRTGRPSSYAATLAVCLIALSVTTLTPPTASAGVPDVVAEVQPKSVKIYGAGGIRGLEAYQSGFLISSDGYVATVWSYVLDTDDLAVVLDDGSRHTAEIIYSQPQLDVAILKINATDLPHFDLGEVTELSVGDRVLAFSNLYGIASGDEPVSVLHGHVSAVAPLAARKGAFQIPFSGDVYIVDAMTNNAGAAGGALTNSNGDLVAMLGKEVKARHHDVWLNYALPVAAFREVAEATMRGESVALSDDATERSATPWSLDDLGLQLVPNLIKNTPPFVEQVMPGTPVERAGLKRDDLVAYVGSQMVRSYFELEEALTYIDRTNEIRITVVRDGELATLRIEGLDD